MTTSRLDDHFQYVPTCQHCGGDMRWDHSWNILYCSTQSCRNSKPKKVRSTSTFRRRYVMA